jgi:hypothetical protein
MLVLADRGFFSYVLWRHAIATGADLLWRIRTDQSGPQPTHLRDLDDGSWLAHLRGLTPAAARREEPMLVRVIDYTRRASVSPARTSSPKPTGLNNMSPVPPTLHGCAPEIRSAGTHTIGASGRTHSCPACLPRRS